MIINDIYYNENMIYKKYITTMTGQKRTILSNKNGIYVDNTFDVYEKGVLKCNLFRYIEPLVVKVYNDSDYTKAVMYHLKEGSMTFNKEIFIRNITNYAYNNYSKATALYVAIKEEFERRLTTNLETIDIYDENINLVFVTNTGYNEYIHLETLEIRTYSENKLQEKMKHYRDIYIKDENVLRI